MQKKPQSDDQFEQLNNDELLLYSYSSHLHNSPRNKTQNNRINQNSQYSKLKLVDDLNHNKNDLIFDKYVWQKDKNKQRLKIIKIGDAIFKSNFQCGNLSNVDCIGANTYLLHLNNELNSDRMSLWFYFSCQGLKGEVNFVISGFSKPTSLYNEGMKICYRQSNDMWRRGCSKISYQQNQLNRQATDYLLKFTFFFPNSGNSTYQFAFCYPYSFSKLLKFINGAGNNLMVQTLAKSYDGRSLPLLTIGNHKSQNVIFLSARVHPGQTVSSWIMQGFIKQLLNESISSKMLRKSFLFKIVPMLNPDGVFYGNYRFSAAGCDLNRKWTSCTAQKHPQIYYWRDYIRKINQEKNVLMYIDIHGHSRKKNVFFYGCCPIVNGVENQEGKEFPYLMEEVYGTAFKYQYCSFTMPKDKQGTARLTLNKQLKNNYIYTLQSTFCGGSNNSNYIESDYQKIGMKLCQGMATYFSDKFIIQKNLMQHKTIEFVEKIKQLKIKRVQQFIQDPVIKSMGMAEESGSQSDPQAGQNKGKYDKNDQVNNLVKSFTPSFSLKKDRGINGKKQMNKAIELKRKRKNSEFGEFVTLRVQTPMYQQYNSNYNHYNPNSHQNQKNRTGTTIFKREKFNSYKTATVKQNADFVDQQENREQINIQINNLNNVQSIRRKLMLERGGAQYRRIKKLSEQMSKNNLIDNNIMPAVRGLVGANNNLKLDPMINTRSKTITQQHFYPMTSQGSRNRSHQAGFRKNFAKRIPLCSQKLQVKCFGKKILIH